MDIRTRLTIQMIQESFFSLMQDLPVSKITVKEICQKADINRSTFYKYYSDPYDLLRQTENELIDRLQEQITASNSVELSDIFRIILSDIYAKKDKYLVLFSQSDGKIFRERLFSLCYEDNREVIKSHFPDLPAEQQNWLYYFVADGCNSVLKQWIQGGFSEPIEEVVSFLQNIIDTINGQK